MFYKTTKQINTARLRNAFPLALKPDVDKVVDFLKDENFDIHDSRGQEVILNGEKLIIPPRVYFNAPSVKTVKKLTDIQQTILNCIYLRHHNGFVRQERLELLLNNTEYFITPFIFQLLGEYIIQIIEIIYNLENDFWLKNFVLFVKENKQYWQLTECRMVSYWK